MINNNDETILLLHLECLTRVYLNDIIADRPDGLSAKEKRMILEQINNKLIEIDQARGCAFDVKASTQQWLLDNVYT